MNTSYTVFVKRNEKGFITGINSSAFLDAPTDWTEIGSGMGDKFHHAQGNYFPLPIMTGSGAYRYKMVDGQPVECTPEEIQQQEEANQPEPGLSQEDRIKALEEELALAREELSAAKLILGVK